MDLVIDTSAILAVLLDEPERRPILTLTRGATLLVPSSMSWEVGNAVVSLVRRGRLSADDGDAVLRQLEEIPLRTQSISIRAAVRLAIAYGLYAYDAYFLEASRTRGCPLLTLDRALIDAAREAGIETLEVIP